MVRKRPGTVAVSADINYKYNIPVVPHLICGGLNKENTEDALIDLHYLGMHNLLALRGDPPRGEKVFIPEVNGHANLTNLPQFVEIVNGIPDQIRINIRKMDLNNLAHHFGIRKSDVVKITSA